jgi:hypothetical protein
MSDPVVGYCFLVDGSKRPVYEDRHGQYVVNDHADRVYGVSIIPPVEPDTPLAVDVALR